MNCTLRRVALVASGVVLVDQVTKFVAESVARTDTGAIAPLRNGELSLGLADGAAPLLVGLMALGIALAAAWVLPRVVAGRLAPWTAAALLAGAASNLIDRAVLGSVRDFLAIPSVAVVNVADVAVVAGLAAIAVAVIRRPRRIALEEAAT